MGTGWFAALNPILQALTATLFTWSVTSLGASLGFFFKGINRKIVDGMLRFAAGVMIAASFWSVLAPAIEMAEESGLPAWRPAAARFLLEAFFLWGVDKLLPHLHLGFPLREAAGVKTGWQRSVLLVLVITLNNTPEGLAVGVAFGAVAAILSSASLAGAVTLALGIGLPRIPTQQPDLPSL
jgi:ZIP family zinc transporter